MFKELWYKTVTSDMEFDDNNSYRRVILVNAILFLTVLTFTFFTFYNLFVQHYVVAALDAVAAFVSFFTLVHLRIYKNINSAAKIATANLALFFVLFTYTNGGDHFGLIWTIFLPIFAILVNGRPVELYFSMLF